MTAGWLRASLSCAALAFVGLPQTAIPQDAPQSSFVDDRTLSRTITLDQLGFGNGLKMDGFSGVRELYFPVPEPDAVRSLSLRLPFVAASAFDSRRSIQIDVAGEPVLTRSLNGDEETGILEVPIDQSAIVQGFVPVTIRYNGALTEDRCIDQRIAGAYLQISPTAGLSLNIARSAVQTLRNLASAMPMASDIILPADPTEDQAAAAILLAANNSDARIFVGSAPPPQEQGWRRSVFRLTSSTEPGVSISDSGPWPEISLGGASPQDAARLITNEWHTVFNGQANIGKFLRRTEGGDETLTFADLGGDVSSQTFSDTADWQITLPLNQVPAGQTPSKIAVDILVADDGSDTAPVISVTLNGLLLGSAAAQTDKRMRLTLDIPDGLTTSANDLKVSVIRQIRGGDCAYAPQGYPAQLLPSSHFSFKPQSVPDDFAELAPLFAGGVSLVLDSAADIPATSELLGPLLNVNTPLEVSFGKVPATGPYVLVSGKVPAGTSPALRFDRGEVEFSYGEDGPSLIAGPIGAATAIQLLNDGDRSVLWIRPGANFASLNMDQDAETLGLGNVALADEHEIMMAYSTTRDRLVDIRYPDQVQISELLERYRVWLIGLGWLILSAGFVYLLRRSRRPKDE
ncbi:cellulose biosynthesis cyclic di-GMP-binding regulatory protein BcsB [Altericroceibacterium endophyticum]|uniref:Cyclic di-GMP-binding protein n=1 Tax=Altericroceibacterium endophyticum TaxID=1808508 RepID=A0A6I4T885_9SPHN|nr:cellulose biosynthesis cyclic di-GMP-binding regulatory protein BcsB [Altericroceibacterium endophyticum]MXO66070.1 hypothetical protein [Altericroceibacterium endophyticum]